MSVVLDRVEERDAPSLARGQVVEGYSLPAFYYQDADRFEQDMAIATEKSWFLAGHASQIPQSGDYFLFEVADESIIIIRSREGGINAFFNVCRHRGSRVCLEPAGRAPRMMCPYHAWTYDTNGKLIASPDMRPDFDKKAHGLKICHAQILDGLIFVNLATGDAPDFEHFAARVRPFLKPYDLANTKVIARDVTPCPANWKIVSENFAECYHCSNAHQEYARTHAIGRMMDFQDGEAEAEAAEWVARAKTFGLHTEPLFDDGSTFDRQSGLSLKIGGNSLSGGKDGKPLAPRLGEISEWTGSWTGVVFNPYCTIGCYDDHAILFMFVPRTPMQTDCTLMWLVRADAVEGEDYVADDVAYMWRHTIAEDKTICANNQAGVSSRAYQPGPYSTTEGRALGVTNWYLRHFVDQIEGQ